MKNPPSSKTAGNSVVVSYQGKDLSFPPYIDFDGTRWIRSKWHPSPMVDGVFFDYSAQDDDVVLRYFQGNSHGIEWLLEIYKRDGPDAAWAPAGKSLGLDAATGEISEATIGRDRLRNGQARIFYPNGALKMEYNIVPFETKQGPAAGFYPSGKLCWEADYVKGELSLSNAMFFDENGVVLEGASLEEKEELYQQWVYLTTPREDTRPR